VVVVTVAAVIVVVAGSPSLSVPLTGAGGKKEKRVFAAQVGWENGKM
jgi:hypothetical protein